MTFITSNAGLVSFLRAQVPEVSGSIYDVVYKTYKGFLPGTQFVSAPSIPSMSGPLGFVVLSEQYVSQGTWGNLVLKSSSVSLLGFAFTLATFLALTINWGTRQPILWQISFSSSVYNGVYQNPLFVLPLGYQYSPSPEQISPSLREF